MIRSRWTDCSENEVPKNKKHKSKDQNTEKHGARHVALSCDPRTWKVEIRGSRVQGQPVLHETLLQEISPKKKGKGERKRKISSSMEKSSFSCCVRDSVIYSNELTSNTPGPQKFNPCSYCISNVNSSPLCSYTMWNVKFLLLLQENNFLKKKWRIHPIRLCWGVAVTCVFSAKS